MRKLVKHELPEDTSLNLTPLMDVIFQLLVFFVLTSSLTRPTQIEMQLPESTSGVKAPEAPGAALITYRLGEQGPVVTLNERPVAGLDALSAALRELAAGAEAPRVDVQIDRTAPCQDVIRLMDAVRNAGLVKFSLHTLAASPPRTLP